MWPSGQKCEHQDIGWIRPATRNTGKMIPGIIEASVSEPENTRFNLENVDSGSRKRNKGNPIADEKMIPQNKYPDSFFLKKCFLKFFVHETE